MKTDKIILSSLNPNDTWGGTSIRQDSKLVDAEGICICIPATHAQHQFKILIRNSENMEEVKIEQVGNLYDTDSFGGKGRVVNRHPVGVANCVTASKRDNTQNYVCCAMRGRGESGNTEQRIEPRKDDLTNTITTVQKDNLVSNNNIRIRGGLQTIVGSKQAHAFRASIEGISPSMTAAMGTGGGQIPLLTNATIQESKSDIFMEQMRGHNLPSELKGNNNIRIRKLTPRECFRLMGVDDNDIDTIQAAGISNSQQYKMAGNSIVVDVLYYIFANMFLTEEDRALL